jgi:hypothetical protein
MLTYADAPSPPQASASKKAPAKSELTGGRPVSITAALLLLYCCFTADLLVLYCCFTSALLLLLRFTYEWTGGRPVSTIEKRFVMDVRFVAPLISLKLPGMLTYAVANGC